MFENEKSSDTTKISEESEDLSDIPPLKGDEEKVKEGKRLNIITSNKSLNWLPTLLAQIKAENNSYKLKKGNQTNTISFVPA